MNQKLRIDRFRIKYIPKLSGNRFKVPGSAQPPAKKTVGQIEIETFGAQFLNLPLLGFALRIRTGKM
jgi:hypothetical protein